MRGRCTTLQRLTAAALPPPTPLILQGPACTRQCAPQPLILRIPTTSGCCTVPPCIRRRPGGQAALLAQPQGRGRGQAGQISATTQTLTWALIQTPRHIAARAPSRGGCGRKGRGRRRGGAAPSALCRRWRRRGPQRSLRGHSGAAAPPASSRLPVPRPVRSRTPVPTWAHTAVHTCAHTPVTLPAVLCHPCVPDIYGIPCIPHIPHIPHISQSPLFPPIPSIPPIPPVLHTPDVPDIHQSSSFPDVHHAPAIPCIPHVPHNPAFPCRVHRSTPLHASHIPHVPDHSPAPHTPFILVPGRTPSLPLHAWRSATILEPILPPWIRSPMEVWGAFIPIHTAWRTMPRPRRRRERRRRAGVPSSERPKPRRVCVVWVGARASKGWCLVHIPQLVACWGEGWQQAGGPGKHCSWDQRLGIQAEAAASKCFPNVR